MLNLLVLSKLNHSYMRKILTVQLSLIDAGIPHGVPAQTLCNGKNKTLSSGITVGALVP